MSDDMKAIFVGILIGFVIAGILNSLPIADAYKHRAAIAECEKSLPRDKHCKVIGVAE
jgi:hypothetical protein